MCMRAYIKEVKLKELVRLGSLYVLKKGKKVWTSRDNKLWGSD